MKQFYYNIPFDFKEVFRPSATDEPFQKPHKRVLSKTDSLKQSIDEHIELIIMTHFGEYKHNREFGFILWEKEFENIEIEKFNTHNNPKQGIEDNLKITLNKFEPRLKNINVDILFVYKKVFRGKKIKYFVDITVKGNLTNKMEQPYERSFQFAMGPFFK